MTGMSRLSKLAELRGKTDGQLITVISTEMDLGLRLALMAEAQLTNNPDSAESARMRAETIYDESVILLPAVDDLRERRRLEGKLTRLREALDRLSAPKELRVQPACSSA